MTMWEGDKETNKEDQDQEVCQDKRAGKMIPDFTCQIKRSYIWEGIKLVDLLEFSVFDHYFTRTWSCWCNLAVDDCMSACFQVHHLPQDWSYQEQSESCVAAVHHPRTSALQRRLRPVSNHVLPQPDTFNLSIPQHYSNGTWPLGGSHTLLLLLLLSHAISLNRCLEEVTWFCVLVRIMPAVGHVISIRPVLVLLKPTWRQSATFSHTSGFSHHSSSRWLLLFFQWFYWFLLCNCYFIVCFKSCLLSNK